MDPITRDTHPPANAHTVVPVEDDEAIEDPRAASIEGEGEVRYIDPAAPLQDA